MMCVVGVWTPIHFHINDLLMSAEKRNVSEGVASAIDDDIAARCVLLRDGMDKETKERVILLLA
jgi:hypothetical protein